MDTKSNNDFLSDYIISPIYTFSNNIGNSIGNTIDTIGNVPSMVSNNNVVSSIGQSVGQAYISEYGTIIRNRDTYGKRNSSH